MTAWEVRAILDGRKTQFRRIFKFRETNNPPACPDKFDPKAVTQPCPFGQPGDRLWVRETFIREPAEYDLALSSRPYREASTVYRADVDRDEGLAKWSPSIHMPRKLSRIMLEVVSTRVERLQDVSDFGACCEGVGRLDGPFCKSYRDGFYEIWQSIHGKKSWGENPWVRAVEFRRLEGAQ